MDEPEPDTADETRHIERVASRVWKEIGGAVPTAQVEAQVRACFEMLADAPIRDFVPILAEREALNRLLAAHGAKVSRRHLRALVT